MKVATTILVNPPHHTLHYLHYHFGPQSDSLNFTLRRNSLPSSQDRCSPAPFHPFSLGITDLTRLSLRSGTAICTPALNHAESS